MIEIVRVIVELALLCVMSICVLTKSDLRILLYVAVMYLAFVIRSNQE